MKNTVMTIAVMTMLTSCGNMDSTDPEITEEEAKQIVIEERSRECCKDPEIQSVISKADSYIVQWEINSIDEQGKDSVHKKTSEVKKIESSRGACKWK